MPAAAYLRSTSQFDVGNTGLSGTREWIVTGANEDDEAYAAVLSAYDPSYFGIPVGSIGGEHLGGGVYHVTVKYDPMARSDAPAAGGDPGSSGGVQGGGNPAGGESGAAPMGREWSITTGSGTKHITRSRFTVSKHAPAGQTAPNYNGLIGVSASSVEGTDIISPEPNIRVSRKIQTVTLGYFLRLCEYVGKANNGAWKGIGDKEALFTGAELNFRDGDGWNESLTFRYSPTNRDAIELGQGADKITIPAGAKLGWDYLWAAYRESNTATEFTQAPYAAYIEDVYETRDFAFFNV